MIRIIGSRGTGKTHRLLSIANLEGAIITCSNPRALQSYADYFGFENVTILPYSKVFDTQFKLDDKYKDKNIYIDEIELMLKHISDRIKGYTLSQE